MTAILGALSGCAPELGRLRIFQRSAVRSPDTPTPALHGAQVHLEVREQHAASPVVSGRFPVRGLELDLPAGTYAVATWFRPYDHDMQLGPASARCEGLAVVATDAITSVVRVQDDWTHCHFEPGEADWNVSVRASEWKATPWWVVLAHDGADRSFLELGLPLPVAAVFFDVPPDGRKLRVAASLMGEDGTTMRACTGTSTGCPALENSCACRSTIRASDLARSEPTELFVRAQGGGRKFVSDEPCLIPD